MLGRQNSKIFFAKNLHENRFLFPKKRNGFVLDRKHGRRHVTCKPAIALLTKMCLALTLRLNKWNSFQYKSKGVGVGGGGVGVYQGCAAFCACGGSEFVSRV